MFSITPLTSERLEAFFGYLSAHIAENGEEGALLFLPLGQQQSVLSGELRSKFELGMSAAFGEPGWRKAWVALSRENRIVGHVDLRMHPQPNAAHRVLLGMGVDRQHRGHQIGRSLLQCAIEFGRRNPEISWIDLEVLTQNSPARNLYEKMGFELIGTTRDMFRIDGRSYDYSAMTLKVGE